MRDALKPELPILTLVGRTSAIARGAIGAGLPADADDREIVCFATFSPATFPVGSEFAVAFARPDPTVSVPVKCRLLAVTQEFGAAMPEIPIGWRTVCLLQFELGIPPIVAELPLVDSWSQGFARVGLCTVDTFLEVRDLLEDFVSPRPCRYLYSAWFRDDTLPTDDQDHEWVACFLVEASSPEDAQRAGDQLARARAVRAREPFLSSSVALPDGSENLPVVRARDLSADRDIGW
jgi:hypothetical protein